MNAEICIICGRAFPAEMCSMKYMQNGELIRREIPREVCHGCSDRAAAFGGSPVYPIADGEGALRLAGRILRGWVQQYRHEYERALAEVDGTADELARQLPHTQNLLRMQREARGRYLQTISLGRITDVCAGIRRERLAESAAARLVEGMIREECEGQRQNGGEMGVHTDEHS